MQKYNYKGQVIEFDLGMYGYDGYFAEVIYQCDDSNSQSLITMFIIQKDADGMPVEIINVQKPQYIEADRSDVRRKITHIIEVMRNKKYLDRYINESVTEVAS